VVYGGIAARVAPTGSAPSAPSSVTSITKDAGATVSFLAAASSGSSSITSYTVTPYISGAAQAPTTVPVGSLGSIAGSNGNTYLQATVTGLTNATAYTFSVHASNSSGAGAESSQSGANTPLSGLVFGDDFNGPVSGPIDPEWWVYQRCGYLAQNEIEYYLTDHCTLDGSGNLQLKAEKLSFTGPKYPSAGGGSITQPWRSGACQSNTKTWTPAAGNTMTFEARQQICPDIGGGMWPGLFWLVGQTRLNDWKTDPLQTGWDDTGQAEIDVAEWNPTQVFAPHDYQNNVATGSFTTHNVSTAIDFSAAMHVFTCQWKPGVSVRWLRDGTQTTLDSVAPPSSGAQFFLLLYLQIIAGAATATQSCLIDYVRVYDQNLG
jgi:hypothetical protein